MRYIVIYLWRGERHRDLQSFHSTAQAKERLAAITAKGFSAWIESWEAC